MRYDGLLGVILDVECLDLPVNLAAHLLAYLHVHRTLLSTRGRERNAALGSGAAKELAVIIPICRKGFRA